MKLNPSDFSSLSLEQKIKLLYFEGEFVVAIRYYGYKVNLYTLYNQYVEAFYNHKKDKIEKIELLNYQHSRMKFYSDQVSLPGEMLNN